MRLIFLNLFLILSAFCVQAQTYVTVYTKFGTPIEGMIRTEMTAQEKANALDWVATYFRNAIVLSEPTRLYNCHSYAWNMVDGGITCWINSYDRYDNPNLSKYWDYNEYYVLTTENNATKIHYYNGDHSAIPSPTVPGKYISKWGSCPLMLHDPDDCPYSLDGNYYKNRTYYSGALECSVMNRSVYINETANYYMTYVVPVPNGCYLDYIWSVTDNKDFENIIGTIATITIYGDNANISFNKAGLYIVTCNVHTSIGVYLCLHTIEAAVL